MKVQSVIIIAGCCAGSVLASFPVAEGFDTYLPGQGFVTATNGWWADTSAIQVVASPATNTPNSVDIQSGTLSNGVALGVAPAVVWTEYYVMPVLGVAPPVMTTNGAMHQHYFATNGFVAVATSAGYLSVTQDVQGNLLAPVSTSRFIRVDVCQNYGAHSSALVLDGRVVAQDIPSLTSAPGYRSLTVQSSDQATFLDNVTISTNTPAGIDGNGDGLADTLELQLYGYVARTNLTVGPGQLFSSLQSAINVARARDLIVMCTSSINEALALDHAVRIGGVAFTNAGSCTVSASGVLSITTGFDEAGTLTVAGVVNTAVPLTISSLVMSGSGLINLTGTVMSVVTPLVNLSGTLSVTAAQWSDPAFVSTLPLAEDFEQVAVGTALSDLWFRGWGASDSRAGVVGSPVYAGARAAQVSGVVSNRVDGSGSTTVWTDFRLRPCQGIAPDIVDSNHASFLFYVATNGYISLYNAGRWDSLSNDINGLSAPLMLTSQYSRISIFADFSKEQAALFVNGQLLRQLIPFPRGPAAQFYRALQIANQDGNAFLDNVSIGSALPAGLSGDALLIHQFGTVVFGSVFLLR